MIERNYFQKAILRNHLKIIIIKAIIFRKTILINHNVKKITKIYTKHATRIKFRIKINFYQKYKELIANVYKTNKHKH